METVLKDITTIEDIKVVVDSFYLKIQQDDVVGPYFKDLDWNKHLPIMYAFWSKVILHREGYKGNPFEKHVTLPNLKSKHFDRWLALFKETVDSSFSGNTAEEMKSRAETIAYIFRSKLVKEDV